jgi:uncharacterized caspase-like protein
MWRLVVAITFLLTAVVGSVSSARADKRVALIVGNAEYPLAKRLFNPKNDAEDMAKTLKSLGFEVILRTDANKQEFTRAMADFARAVRGAEVALFYYAGHGMQFQGRNYLMPVDSELRDEVSVNYELVALDEVQQALDRSTGTRVIILDACRNNPLATRFARSIANTSRGAEIVRGLARIEQARGAVVAYATQANEVAVDGSSRNSPFTGALIETLREPGLEIGAMFRKVAARVFEQTQGKQIPELSISLLTDVYLNRNESAAQAWSRVREENNPAALRDFLSRFPTSFYAADANLRLEMLDGAARERELRSRLAALEVERQQASLELTNQRKAAELARTSAAEVTAKDEQIAATEKARREAENRLADLQKQLQIMQANVGAATQEAGRQKAALEVERQKAELDLAKQKVAADRARPSAIEAGAKDKQIATIEEARRNAETRLAELEKQMQALTAQANEAAANRAERGEREDDAAFESAVHLQEAVAFRFYLDQHPTGRHRDEALSQMTALAEAASWERAHSINRLAEYNEYLNSWPAGQHAGEARQYANRIADVSKRWGQLKTVRSPERLRGLLADAGGLEDEKLIEERLDQLQRTDKAAWDKAELTQAKAAYLSYLAEWAEGDYREEAKARLAEIDKMAQEWNRIKGKNDEAALEVFLQRDYISDFKGAAMADLVALKRARKTPLPTGISVLTAEAMKQLINGKTIKFASGDIAISFGRGVHQPENLKLRSSYLQTTFKERFAIEAPFAADITVESNHLSIGGIGGVQESRVDKTGSLFLLQILNTDRTEHDLNTKDRLYSTLQIIKSQQGYVCLGTQWSYVLGEKPQPLDESCQIE